MHQPPQESGKKNNVGITGISDFSYLFLFLKDLTQTKNIPRVYELSLNLRKVAMLFK